MRFLVSILIFMAFHSIAYADTVRKTVPANKVSAVGAHATYSQTNCFAGVIPQFRVLREPKHGSVSFKQQVFKLSKDAGRCAGTTVKGTAIYYKPERGYRGKDEFKLGFIMSMYEGEPRIRNVVNRFVIEIK